MDQNESQSISFVGNTSNTEVAVYIFTPAGHTTKLALFLATVIVGVVGIVGNSLIFHFACGRINQINLIEKSLFMKNFNLYIKK